MGGGAGLTWRKTSAWAVGRPGTDVWGNLRAAGQPGLTWLATSLWAAAGQD